MVNQIVWKPRNFSEIKKYTTLIEPDALETDWWHHKYKGYYRLQLKTSVYGCDPMILWKWHETVTAPTFDTLHEYFQLSKVFGCYCNKLNHVSMTYDKLDVTEGYCNKQLFMSLIELKLKGANVSIDPPNDKEFECLNSILRKWCTQAGGTPLLVNLIPLYQPQKQFLQCYRHYPYLDPMPMWDFPDSETGYFLSVILDQSEEKAIEMFDKPSKKKLTV